MVAWIIVVIVQLDALFGNWEWFGCRGLILESLTKLKLQLLLDLDRVVKTCSSIRRESCLIPTTFG